MEAVSPKAVLTKAASPSVVSLKMSFGENLSCGEIIDEKSFPMIEFSAQIPRAITKSIPMRAFSPSE